MANRWGNNRNNNRLSILGSKITVDGEIERCLLLRRKTLTNIDSVLKNRDITLLTKVYIVKSMVFSNSHVWMWELDNKKGWDLKNWCLWTVVLEKTRESPWIARRSNQSILKDINPEYSLEGLILKLQYFATWCEGPTHWKRP